MPLTKKKSSIYIPKQSLLFQSDIKDSLSFGNLATVPDTKNGKDSMIEASAGTGKTFALVELVLELVLEQEIPLKKILLVTFTEKATTELKLRLRKKFRDLLNSFDQNDPSLREIPNVPFWEINSLKINLIKAALLDFDSAQVYTIHGFCKRVLSEFAFENCQLIEQKFCDTNLIFQEVFSRYVRKDLLSKDTAISKLFNLYVKQNVGNLETLRKDILSLLYKNGEFTPNLPPFEFFLDEFPKFWNVLISKDLCLRNKNCSRHPIRSAFDLTALNKKSREKTLCNLDLILKILTEVHSGKSNLVILSKFFEVSLSSITNPKCRKVLEDDEIWSSPAEFPLDEKSWIDALSECEKFLMKYKISGEPKRIFKAWLIQNVIKELRKEISQTKLENGMFDFEDLLVNVEKELRPLSIEKSVTSPLTKALRKKYLYAIVDEFQDTDKLQWSIFNHLFLESSKHRLIVIGDPKQSIYSFRGADIFTYLQARKKFKEKTSRFPFVLDKNFRSSKIMISGLNKIFSGDLLFPGRNGIIYDDVECGNHDLELKDKISNRNAIHLLELSPQFLISVKKMQNQKKIKNPNVSPEILEKLDPLKGKKFFGEKNFLKALSSVLNGNDFIESQNFLLNLFLCDQSENATSRFSQGIALEIKNILRIDNTVIERPIWKDENGERPIMARDICVLFRKINEGEKIAKSLSQHGIDFEFYKQKGLFSGREAKEILDLLEAVENPNDLSRRGKLCLTRFFDIEINEITKVNLSHRNLLYKLQEWNSIAGDRNFSILFENILESTKLIRRELFLAGDERCVTNYLHIFEVLNKQISEKHLNLFELIQLLKRFIDGKENPDENENFLRIESERNAVQLMTMHASKGLEFPIVFLLGGLTGGKKGGFQFYHDAEEKQIIDLMNSKVPSEFRWQEIAENQRLLYVAMTRARGRLYLPFVGSLSNESDRRVCKIDGGYSIVNEQLSKILEKNIFNTKNSPFSISDILISCQSRNIDIDQRLVKNLKNWIPVEFPENPIIQDKIMDTQQFFNHLRLKKRGFVVTSFSKLNRKENLSSEGNRLLNIHDFPKYLIRSDDEFNEIREIDEIELPILDDPIEENLNSEIEIEVSENQLKHKIKKDELSGGLKTGNLLHDLLERTDFSIIYKSESIEKWLARKSVRGLIQSFNESYGNPSSMIPRLAEIIWNTLRTPIKLGNRQDSPKLELASIKKDLREVDFYFPIPKKGKNVEALNQKKQNGAVGWKIENGFLRGSIDYLFEHKGKIYFLDWKSNILENYEPETLKREVSRHYELQLQIYTLATCYWFKLDFEKKFNEKFGGALYLFLRGVNRDLTILPKEDNKETVGVYYRRPTWDEFKNYEDNLSLKFF